MQLYKIASEYAQALEALEQMEDVTPEMIEDSLVNIKDSLETKVINISYYLENIEADIFCLEQHRSDMNSRIEKYQKLYEKWAKYIKNNMELAGVKKVKGLEFDVSIRHYTKTDTYDMAKLMTEAPEYVKEKITYSDDKKAIKEAIERGIEVPGSRLEKTTSLVIK